MSAAANQLAARAVLPAATFAEGPTSGTQLGSGPINGQQLPFIDKQPIQGFSALLDNGDATFMAMSDNGFGRMENSADYHLRVYIIRPDFKTAEGGSGTISVEGFIELHDPDGHIPFAITNHFTAQRILTGADFDPESLQRAPDGTLWFGDEFGPFLIHTDAYGRVLEPPIPLPDFEGGGEIRSPQNPCNEEASAVRVMNAVRTHAQLHGNHRAPVFSPWHVMLADGNPQTFVDSRENPPPGLAKAASEIFAIDSIQRAGYPIVTWTVNDKPRMLELMRLGVNGIISDRPDLLREVVEAFDADGDGTPGDLLDAKGLIDGNKFDAQGHRGGRDLRPENTLAAMEVALDNLMTTLETDTGITADGVVVLNHDPSIEAAKCRKVDNTPYSHGDEVLVKDLSVAQIQSLFICDKLQPDRPAQTNDRSLSPVAVAFAAEHGLSDPYVMPTLQQLFDFVAFYVDYYRSGPGRDDADARRRYQNAQRVRFNIETKINPRAEFAHRSVAPEPFAQAVAGIIMANNLAERADIQSFDFRTLLIVQEQFPKIRTVYLFGDLPMVAGPTVSGSGEGSNLQDEGGVNTPWLAGLFWPYRVTARERPFRARCSGGFAGMALTSDGARLLPLLARPLDGKGNTLLIHEFDLASRSYTGKQYKYLLNERGIAIGDFIMFSPSRGMVIERDDTQGDLNGFKAIYEVKLRGPDQAVIKQQPAVDLLNIGDVHRLSQPGEAGDAGIGRHFAFPFVTIEAVLVFDCRRIGVLNDNNYPFSVGRHVGSGRPDDNEFIVIDLERPLGSGGE